MLLNEITTYLAAQGRGTVGTTLFYSAMPPDIDNCVAVYEYPGRAGDYGTADGKAFVERPRFQVIVRNTDYDAAMTLARQIRDDLEAVANEKLSSARYYSITALQPPFQLLAGAGVDSARDSSDRTMIACNYEAQRANV